MRNHMSEAKIQNIMKMTSAVIPLSDHAQMGVQNENKVHI